MIHLLPYYQSLNNEIHRRDRDSSDSATNKKYSLSILNSVLPAMIEYVVENSDKCIVIATPSPKESQLIVSYLIRQIANGVSGFHDLNVIKYFDLNPSTLSGAPGIHVACYNAIVNHVVSCDTIVSYYPFPFDLLKNLYNLADTLALFDPVNTKGNGYADFIRRVIRKENGVRR